MVCVYMNTFSGGLRQLDVCKLGGPVVRFNVWRKCETVHRLLGALLKRCDAVPAYALSDAIREELPNDGEANRAADLLAETLHPVIDRRPEWCPF